MSDKEFRGSYTVTVTPFTENGEAVDIPTLKKFLDWQIDMGAPGLIVLGTTGEFLAISEEERDEIVETSVKHVAGRVPVLIGASNAYTPTAVRFARNAEAMGANGLMIAPPYYYTPTHDEIFNYYKVIAEAVSIPIMLYNNPITTNVDMPASLIGKLTRSFETVRYIKEASMDVARVYDIVEETQGVMNVFAGERIVESFLLGAVGYVNPYGNYLPHATSRIWDFLVQGRIENAKEIERLVNSLDEVIAEGHPTYGHQCYSKALAGAVGMPVGDVRPPLTTFAELGEEGIERRDKIMKVIAEIDALMKKLDSKAA